MIIYLIGSLRNPEIPLIGNRLRQSGFEIFDDWFAGGKIADDEWRDYEILRGHSYQEALEGYAAEHVFEYDKFHLNRADGCVLAMPAGKSSHIELGYMLGQNKPGWVLFDQIPERYDVMFKFSTKVCFSIDELVREMEKYEQTKINTL